MIAPNTIIGKRYRVTRALGGGGMKQVYLAADNGMFDRPCALAEMIDNFTDPKEQQAAADSFQREAATLARLEHDNIVRIYDRLSDGNRHYLVMEYVEGDTLEQLLESAPTHQLDEKTVIAAALQILDALEYLHARTPPVIYRDLKPANVMLRPGGRVKLIDFGIARLFIPKKTATMVGTQGYAPPEQYEGKAEPRSDLYALGATMVHLLTGWDPAEHSPFMFPALRSLRRDLDPALETLINEALTLDVNRRIGSAGEFRRRLENIKSPSGGLMSGAYAPSAAVSAPVNASGPGAPTVTGIVATQRCPRCARDIPADAVVCPYCSAQLKPVVVLTPKRRRWPLVAAALLVLAGAAFGGTYYYENTYLPRQAAIAQPKPKGAAEAVAPAQTGAQTREEAQAAAAQRAQLMATLGEQLKRLQSSKPGSKAEQEARAEAIATALKITPPPEIPAEAQALFDRAKADLTAASTAKDYRRAAEELGRALRMAPWHAEGWMNLADADEGANDPGGAIVSLRVYLLAAPASASAASIGVRISELEQQAAQQRQQAEEQRKLAELKQQESLTPGHTFKDCDGCPEMVVVPSGSFTMGDDTYTPTHQVTIGRNFAVGKYPVTRDEYARFAAATHANGEWKDPGFPQTGRDPVVSVNWNDAKAYAAWLSRKTGHTYRLLSEAEYEYAERAGTTTKYWWGDDGDEACSHACYDGDACHHKATVPVGSYPANGFGLYDMAGNVWEWTEDCLNDSYAGAPDDGTAWTSGDCGRRVQRGGSWDNGDRDLLQSAYRNWYNTGLRYFDFGFRVARTL